MTVRRQVENRTPDLFEDQGDRDSVPFQPTVNWLKFHNLFASSDILSIKFAILFSAL